MSTDSSAVLDASGVDQEDLDFVNSLSDELDTEDTASESVEQAEQAEENSAPISADEASSEESEESDFPEDHDPMATLNSSKEESSLEQRYPKSAVNLANKFADLSEDEKANKVASLFNTKGREQELSAIADAEGISIEDLIDKYTEEVFQEDTQADPAQIDIDALVEQKLRERLAPQLAQSERIQFGDEIQKWAKHNKIDDISGLSDVTGEVYKAFTDARFNPTTGEPLDFNGRMAIALKSDQAQESLIKSGAIKGAKQIVKGINAKLTKTSPENLEGEDFDEWAERMEKEARGF